VLSCRRTGRVEEALLGEEHEGPLRDLAAPRGGLRRGDLFQRRSQVDGRRTTALLGSPWDGRVQRPVELEHAGPVPEALERFR
jgi:hypothetical protein